MDTTIKVSQEVRDRLKGIGLKGESYSDVLTRLLNDGPTEDDVELAERYLATLQAIEAISVPEEDDVELAERYLATLQAIQVAAPTIHNRTTPLQRRFP